MAKTLKERYTAGLLARGWVHEKSLTHHEVYACPGRPESIYVGRAGAVRIGLTVSSSVPVSDRFKQVLLQAGEASHGQA